MDYYCYCETEYSEEELEWYRRRHADFLRKREADKFLSVKHKINSGEVDGMQVRCF